MADMTIEDRFPIILTHPLHTPSLNFWPSIHAIHTQTHRQY